MNSKVFSSILFSCLFILLCVFKIISLKNSFSQMDLNVSWKKSKLSILNKQVQFFDFRADKRESDSVFIEAKCLSVRLEKLFTLWPKFFLSFQEPQLSFDMKPDSYSWAYKVMKQLSSSSDSIVKHVKMKNGSIYLKSLKIAPFSLDSSIGRSNSSIKLYSGDFSCFFNMIFKVTGPELQSGYVKNKFNEKVFSIENKSDFYTGSLDLKKELSLFLANWINEDLLSFLSTTSVFIIQPNADYSSAKIYLSGLGAPSSRRQNLLRKAKAVVFRDKGGAKMSGSFSFDHGVVELEKLGVNFDNNNLVSAKLDCTDFMFKYGSFVGEFSGPLNLLWQNNDFIFVQTDGVLRKGAVKVEPDFFVPKKNFRKMFVPKMAFNVKLKTEKSIECIQDKALGSFDLDIDAQGVYAEKTFHGSGRFSLGGRNIILFDKVFDKVSLELAFDKEKLDKPFFNSLFSTRIKHHQIQFHGTGPIDDFILNASSNTGLDEKQIFSLFFTGTDNYFEGIKRFFSAVSYSYDDASFSKKFLKKVIAPLPGFKVLPCMSEKSNAVLPVKAGLFVDIGEKTIASVEKGFDDGDDLNLNLEYFLSNNLSLKFSRNSNGNLQGMVEMKFKV